MNNIIKRVWNQNRLVNIEDLTGMAFQAEADGHTFEISGIDDTGAAVTLSGTVSGVFRRPDNADIALTGSASDGVVSVTLSEDCYAVPGRFGLTIFVTSNSQKVAVYACVGTVAVSSTGNVAGDTPANVEDLIDDINAAIADLNSAIGQIPASYANVMAAIAPTYSGSALYPVGAYAWHNGSLCRCTTPITTAEAWTAAHWTAAVLGDDVSDISEETRNMFSGEIGTTNGMALEDGTLTNTNTDGRTRFFCIIRFRNDVSNIIASTVEVISAPSRYAFTLTPTSNGNNIQIVHNGSNTNLLAPLLCNFEANKTYTVSFDVDGCNPNIVGGLIISKIQVEIGDIATDYISHVTARDDVARGGNEQLTDKFDAISAHSPNLFNGTISVFSNMEENDGKIENTNTDTRSGFFFTVKYKSGSTIIDSSATIPITFCGRIAQTLTATADCTAIQVVHNGIQRNLSFTIPFTVNAGETYTVSLNVEGYNVTVVGGLILSDIQIELGNKETAYIPGVYTAVDYVARDNIDARTPEAKLNVLLMGDSIFGNDGEIALFLDQMCNSCVNGAFGGTRVSVRPSTSGAFRFFDGVNIITALCTQTWTDQDAAAEILASDYPWIAARLAGLKAVDMSDIDLLVMDWGTNDYTGGVTIEDITTAYGTVIDLLQTTYPELRILITTPIWRYWGTEADNENGDNKVYNVSTLKEIALAIEAFMKNKRISVLNAYQNLPLSYKTADTYFDSGDKTHLNIFGNKVYAGLIHGKIRSIY